MLTGGKLGTKEKPPADAAQVILGSVLQHVQGTLPVLQGRGEIRGSSCILSKGVKALQLARALSGPQLISCCCR